MMVNNANIAMTLINMCADIGGIAETNAPYMQMLIGEIDKANIPLDHMTLRTLIEIHAACGKRFNAQEELIDATRRRNQQQENDQ